MLPAPRGSARDRSEFLVIKLLARLSLAGFYLRGSRTPAFRPVRRASPGLASGQNVVCDDTRLTTICFGWLDTEGYEPHRRRGNKMATIPMIPVDPVKTLNRSIILTKEGMSGSGGDDFICGHCGSVILEDYNPSTVRGNPIYQCGFCENNNDLPFSANHSRHWSSR